MANAFRSKNDNENSGIVKVGINDVGINADNGDINSFCICIYLKELLLFLKKKEIRKYDIRINEKSEIIKFNPQNIHIYRQGTKVFISS